MFFLQYKYVDLYGPHFDFKKAIKMQMDRCLKSLRHYQ